jgi:DNA-binding MarR family transcriptional regulator
MQKREEKVDSIQVEDSPRLERTFSLTDYPMYLIGYIRQMNYAGLQDILAPLGATPYEWRILASLQETDGQTMSTLSGHTITERTYLTKIVAKMEAEGLVTRLGDKADRRLVRIFITSYGMERFRSILPAAQAHFEETLRLLGATERKTLTALLGKIAAGLDKVQERHPLMPRELSGLFKPD